MEISMTTPKVATTGASGAGANATQGGQSAGDAGKASFAGALIAIVGGDNNTAKTDDATLTLAALLQGLSPALLAALLPQTGDAGGEEATKQLLEALGGQPELLAQLLTNPGFQQWLQQANELLTAMGNDTGVPVGSLPVHTEGGSAAANASFGGTQAKMIIAAFVQTMQQHPDSMLFQQLTQSFGETFAEALVQTTAAQGEVAASETKGANAAKQPAHAQAQAAAATKAALVQEVVARLVDDAAQDELVPQLQQFVAKMQTSKLDLLSAKHVAQRMMLAASAPADSTKADNASGETTLPSMPLFQTGDALRTLHSQNAKPAGETIQARNFVQDMSQFVIKAIKVNPLNGFSEAKLSLSPEHLGHVDVKIAMHNGQLVAQFSAQTALGKEMIESQLAQLRATLQNQGIHVERLEVSQSNTMQSGMFQEQRQQQSSQQSNRQSQKTTADYEQLPSDFSQELSEVAGAGNGSNGSVLDVTA